MFGRLEVGTEWPFFAFENTLEEMTTEIATSEYTFCWSVRLNLPCPEKVGIPPTQVKLTFLLSSPVPKIRRRVNFVSIVSVSKLYNLREDWIDDWLRCRGDSFESTGATCALMFNDPCAVARM